MYETVFKTGDAFQFVECVFHAYDRDGDGNIDFGLVIVGRLKDIISNRMGGVSDAIGGEIISGVNDILVLGLVTGLVNNGLIIRIVVMSTVC